MPRSFHITGPCDSNKHYTLSPEKRIPNLDFFIQRNLYFGLYAPPQSGKTTILHTAAAQLRESGIAAAWASLKISQDATRPETAEPQWLASIAQASHLQLPPALSCPNPESFLDGVPGSRLSAFLHAWARQIKGPLVLLFDDTNTIRETALISFLRQLRAGFADRAIGRFATSIGFCGQWDLRGSLSYTRDGTPLHPGTSFNIQDKSISLRNFTESEVGELYGQHTHETGQAFSDKAISAAFYWTQGQPVLVNALARICVEERTTNLEEITDAHILSAKDHLIRSPDTPFEALRQLREPALARVLQTVLRGEYIAYDMEGWRDCVDLGLVRYGDAGVELACPLYRELLLRELG